MTLAEISCRCGHVWTGHAPSEAGRMWCVHDNGWCMCEDFELAEIGCTE